MKRAARPGPAGLFPQRGDPAGRVDQGRRPRRVEAEREPGPAMAVAGAATVLAALALRGPLTGRAPYQPGS